MGAYEDLTATALGYWPLQDDAADTTVVNANGTDGVLIGGDDTADLSAAGPLESIPKSLAFDGTSDYVDTGFTTGSRTSGALAAWLYRTSTMANFDGLVARRAQLSIIGYGDNRVRYNWSNAPAEYNYSGGSPLALNTWTHVVVRVRPTRADFFINGSLSHSNVISHPASVQSADLHISEDGTRIFEGRVAEVLEFDDLTDDEVATLFAGPTTGLKRFIGSPFIGSKFVGGGFARV